jgi:hypothetical protein
VTLWVKPASYGSNKEVDYVIIRIFKFTVAEVLCTSFTRMPLKVAFIFAYCDYETRHEDTRAV